MSANPNGYDVRTGKFADASTQPVGHLAPANRLGVMTAGVGVFSFQASTGQVFYAKRQRAVATPLTPLQLYNATTYDMDGNPTFKLGVVNGTLGSLIPSNMTLGAAPRSVHALVFAVGGSGIIYGDVTSNAYGQFSACIITNGSGLSATPANTATHVYQALGDYAVSGSTLTFNSYLSGSQALSVVWNYAASLLIPLWETL
ncbi:MAG: hypothetical protein ABSE62_05105 [Chthoniobacteraceae bacterium]|jgi:hypothetical protein